MILDFLENTSINFWNSFIDLSTLIFLIVWVIAFFVVQYYLIKGYIFILKFIYNLPIVNETLKKFKSSLEEKFEHKKKDIIKN